MNARKSLFPPLPLLVHCSYYYYSNIFLQRSWLEECVERARSVFVKKVGDVKEKKKNFSSPLPPLSLFVSSSLTSSLSISHTSSIPSPTLSFSHLSLSLNLSTITLLNAWSSRPLNYWSSSQSLKQFTNGFRTPDYSLRTKLDQSDESEGKKSKNWQIE